MEVFGQQTKNNKLYQTHQTTVEEGRTPDHPKKPAVFRGPRGYLAQNEFSLAIAVVNYSERRENL